jgi:dsDNA-binding SOS-regulon protein
MNNNDISYLASINCVEAYADAEAFFDYINSADAINEMLDKMAPSYDEKDTEVTNFFGAKTVPFRLTCQNGLEVK